MNEHLSARPIWSWRNLGSYTLICNTTYESSRILSRLFTVLCILPALQYCYWLAMPIPRARLIPLTPPSLAFRRIQRLLDNRVRSLHFLFLSTIISQIDNSRFLKGGDLVAGRSILVISFLLCHHVLLHSRVWVASTRFICRKEEND